MFKHNRELELDNDRIHDGLEKLIERATDYNIHAWSSMMLGSDESAQSYANERDSYLNAYYLMTGINVDYDTLPKYENER